MQEKEKQQQRLVQRIYDWQRSTNVYAWDANELKAELDIELTKSGLYGKTKKGVSIEIEFPSPNDIIHRVAEGYNLVRVPGGLYSMKAGQNPNNDTVPTAEEQVATQMKQLEAVWNEEE